MADDRRYGRGDDRDRYSGSGRTDENRGTMGGRHEDDRGFIERAGDEVRSWFGDEDADRRRHMDAREDPEHTHHYHSPANHQGGPGGGQWGSRNQPGPSYGQGSSARGAYTQGSFGQGPEDQRRGNYGAFVPGSVRRDHPQSWGEAQDNVHDVHYRNWRDTQMEQLDRDYEEFRRHRQANFNREFDEWRQSRQGQQSQMGQQVPQTGIIAGIREHMEVIGSDGQHVGVVDHVLGDRIKLTRQDPNAQGHHHVIPVSWIASVDDKVRLNKSAEETRRSWTDVDQQAQR